MLDFSYTWMSSKYKLATRELLKHPSQRGRVLYSMLQLSLAVIQVTIWQYLKLCSNNYGESHILAIRRQTLPSVPISKLPSFSHCLILLVKDGKDKKQRSCSSFFFSACFLLSFRKWFAQYIVFIHSPVLSKSTNTNLLFFPPLSSFVNQFFVHNIPFWGLFCVCHPSFHLYLCTYFLSGPMASEYSPTLDFLIYQYRNNPLTHK